MRNSIQKSEGSGYMDVPWRSPTLHIILGTVLIGAMGVSLITPALPALRDSLGITNSETSLIITVFALPGILLAPVIGILVDRFGRRSVLVPCLLLFGGAGSLIALTTDFTTVLFLRFVQGVGASGLSTLAVTLIGDSFDSTQRNAVMGMSSSVLSIGTMVYPLLGGVLAAIAWNAPFVMHLIGVGLGVVALHVLEDEDVEPRSMGLGYPRRAVSSLPLRKAALLYGFATGIFIVLYGGLYTTVPFLLREGYHLDSSQIGVIISSASVTYGLTASQNGRLVRVFSDTQLIGIGFAVYGFSLAIIGVFLGMRALPSPIVIIIPVVVFGVGSGFTIPSVNTAVSSLASEQFRGAVISLRTSFMAIGKTIGPVIFAYGAVLFGYQTLLLVAGTLLLGIGSLTVYVPIVRVSMDTPDIVADD